MAVLKEKVEAKSNDNNAPFNYKLRKIAKFSENDIKTLDGESKLLYNHKAKYIIGKDCTDIVFMPSPHLYEKQEQMKRPKNKQQQLMLNVNLPLVH